MLSKSYMNTLSESNIKYLLYDLEYVIEYLHKRLEMFENVKKELIKEIYFDNLPNALKNEIKKDYKLQLLTKDWKDKRQEILQRDGFKCVICKSNENLQIHHKEYIKGRLAWQYENSWLETLCEKCHKNKHN